MNLPAQLILALALGVAATAAAIATKASTPLMLALIIVSATVLTALLGNLRRGQRPPNHPKMLPNSRRPSAASPNNPVNRPRPAAVPVKKAKLSGSTDPKALASSFGPMAMRYLFTFDLFAAMAIPGAHCMTASA